MRQFLTDGELRLAALRSELRVCCDSLPIQNMCNCRGKLDFEVACKNCKRRTGPLPTRYQAAVSWNEGPHPDPSALSRGYEIHSQEWGYEHVLPRKIETMRW